MIRLKDREEVKGGLFLGHNKGNEEDISKLVKGERNW